MPACMSDDGRQAVMVATMLQTGDAYALCDECIVPWAAGLLNAMTGVDPTPFLAAVSDDVSGGPVSDDELPPGHMTDEDVHELPPPPPERGGRTSAASPAPGTANGHPDGAPVPIPDDATPAA